MCFCEADICLVLSQHAVKRNESPEEAAERMRARAIIDKATSTLRPREKLVLELRYGLDGKGDHTLKEVGKKLEVSKERIRQIEAKALRKLRHGSRMSLGLWEVMTGETWRERQEPIERELLEERVRWFIEARRFFARRCRELLEFHDDLLKWFERCKLESYLHRIENRTLIYIADKDVDYLSEIRDRIEHRKRHKDAPWWETSHVVRY